MGMMMIAITTIQNICHLILVLFPCILCICCCPLAFHARQRGATAAAVVLSCGSVVSAVATGFFAAWIEQFSARCQQELARANAAAASADVRAGPKLRPDKRKLCAAHGMKKFRQDYRIIAIAPNWNLVELRILVEGY